MLAPRVHRRPAVRWTSSTGYLLYPSTIPRVEPRVWRDGSLRGVSQGRLGCSLRTSATRMRGPRHRAHRAGGLPYSIAGRRRRFLSLRHGQPLESGFTDWCAGGRRWIGKGIWVGEGGDSFPSDTANPWNRGSRTGALVEGDARDMHVSRSEKEDRTTDLNQRRSVYDGFPLRRISQDTVERCSRWQLGRGNEGNWARKRPVEVETARENTLQCARRGKRKNGQCCDRAKASAVERCPRPKFFFE